MRRVISFYFFLFSPNEQRAGGGGGALPDVFFFPPGSADHKRDWPPCKKYQVVFFGLATNALNVRNNNSGFVFFIILYIKNPYLDLEKILSSG